MNAESNLNTPGLDGEDNSLSLETQQGKVYLDTIYQHTYVYTDHVQFHSMTLCCVCVCVCVIQINEVRKLIGPQSGKLALYCSDASIARYLRARNWNVKKAVKMLKASLKWRLEYKPEEIRWVTKNLYFHAHQLSINLSVSCLDLVFYFHFAEVEAFMHCPSIDLMVPRLRFLMQNMWSCYFLMFLNLLLGRCSNGSRNRKDLQIELQR